LALAKGKQNQKMTSGERDKYFQQSIIDATVALKLNDNSWKAHYLLAQCHRLQNCLEKALHHYSVSIARSPTQKQVKRDLDSCKHLIGMRSRKEC